MSLEPIKKSIPNTRYIKEENVLKQIKQIVLDVTGVEVGVRSPHNHKIVLIVNNSSAASEINLKQQELLNKVNDYFLKTKNIVIIDKITIQQI